MQLRVESIQAEAAGIRSFTLAHPDGKRLPPFQAGAHVAVTIELDGLPAERRYSLTSAPALSDRYEIAVQLEAASMGGSRYMHEAVEQGDLLEVSEPRNDFSLSAEASRHVLIAGGIGITPLLSMCQELRTRAASFELHYAAKSPARMAFREPLSSLGHDGIHLYCGDPRMNLARILADSKPDAHVYVCGPHRLVEAVRETAALHGWRRDQVHFESFGPRWQADDKPIHIELAQSGLEFAVPVGKPILDGIIENGAWATYDCRRGECGSCVTAVLSGEPDHRDNCLPQSARSDSMCTCVSWARSERLTLDI